MEQIKEIETTGFATMASSMEFANNYNNWILSVFEPYIGKSLLEIGTGQGNFKKYLEGRLTEYASLDIDEDVIKRAKQRDPNGNYYVVDVSANNVKDVIGENKFDTVLCVNVLEHIPDHKKAIENMMTILKPNGHLLLYVPAFQQLYNDMDKLVGHCRRYVKSDFSPLINESTTKIIKNEYFNSIGGLGWYVNKFVSHKDIDSKNVNSQVKFFEKYVVPISRFINPISKHFFGQSLLVVLQKK